MIGCVLAAAIPCRRRGVQRPRTIPRRHRATAIDGDPAAERAVAVHNAPRVDSNRPLNDAMVLYRKGKAQEFKAMMEQAIGIYRKALAQKPNDPATMLALGKTLLLYGEMDEAEQMITRG